MSVKHALQLKENKLIYFRSKECDITVGKVSVRLQWEVIVIYLFMLLVRRDGSLYRIVEDRSAPWHAAWTWMYKLLFCTYLFPYLFLMLPDMYCRYVCLYMPHFCITLKGISVIQISLRCVFFKHMTNAFIDRFLVWLQDMAKLL